MNTKTLAIVALFSAISIILSLSPLKFSYPLATFLKYQVWEIPIVIVFLLYGVKAGVTTSIINTLMLFVFFPGDLPTGPLYNLIAILSMMLGVYIIQKSLGTRFNKGKEIILTALATAAGVVTRVATMSLVNWLALPQSFPFGYEIAAEALPGLVTTIAIFNATIVLYTIPLAYVIARAIGTQTKTQIWK